MENSLETEYRRRCENANETAYDNRLLINIVEYVRLCVLIQVKIVTRRIFSKQYSIVGRASAVCLLYRAPNTACGRRVPRLLMGFSMASS